jgi:hypothetical protein
MGFKIKVKFDKETLSLLTRFVEAVEAFVFPRPLSLKLNLPREGDPTMPFIYKADKPDFDAFVTLQGVDSEGNTIADINVPAGHTLAVVSSDLAGLSVVQDPLNPKRFSYHVGEPNTDESPRPVTVMGTLTRDADGVVILIATDQGTITVGDAVGDPTALGLGLPTA